MAQADACGFEANKGSVEEFTDGNSLEGLCSRTRLGEGLALKFQSQNLWFIAFVLTGFIGCTCEGVAYNLLQFSTSFLTVCLLN